MKTKRPAMLAGVCVVVASLSGAPAFGQQDAEAGKVTPILVVDAASPLEALSDPLDAGLKRALTMLPARLAELPDELPNYQGPDGEMLELVARSLLSGAHRIAVIDRGPDPQTGAPGFAVAADLGVSNEADAKTLQTLILSLLAQAPGAPEARSAADGSDASEIDTPLGALRFGPERSPDGHWRWSVRLGAVGDADALFAKFGRKAGDPNALLRAQLNLQSVLGPLLGMAQMAMGEQAAALAPLTQMLGSRVDFNIERKNWGVEFRFREADAREAMGALGVGSRPLDASDYSIVPADATFASVSRFDMKAEWDMLKPIMAMMHQSGDFFQTLKEQTGVDLKTDVVDALGDAVAYYTADSTGGGGMLSGVIALGVGDRAKLSGAFAKLVEFANGALAQAPPEGPGSYIRLRRVVANGADFIGVRFPGVPVPFEPTFALTDDWLLFALTPQALIGAVDQAADRADGDLGQNLGLVTGKSPFPHDLVSLTYLNTARNVRSGFGITTMLGSALANAVRSPSDATREPGVVTPPLRAMLGQAHAPLMQATWWDGDDFVVVIRAPASITTTTAAATGMIGRQLGSSGAAAAVILPSILLPALERARTEARMIQESTYLKQMHVSMTVYANAHNGQYPETIQAMIQDGDISPDLLESPIEWRGDAEGDFFLRLGGKMTFNDRRIMGYSRAGYATGDTINVVFDDNHVEALTIEEFHARMAEEPNRGVDWRLPRRAGANDPDFMMQPERPKKKAA